MLHNKHFAFGSLMIILILGVFLYINMGCGTSPSGGGAGVPGVPGSGIATTTSIPGIVTAPSGTDIATCNPSFYHKLAGLFISEAYALSGNTPVPYATVNAYNFYNNILVATTTTNVDGQYVLNDIPIGIDVLILVEQAVTGGDIRLSTVVPNVDVQTTITGSIDASTTLASEQLCEYLGQNLRVTVDDVTALVSVAANTLIGTSEIDFRLGAGTIKTTLGTGLVSNEVTAPVIAASPTTAQMTVAVAKAMIQDIRDAGMTLIRYGSTEADKQNANFTNVISPHIASIEAYMIGSVESWLEGKLLNTLPQTVEAYFNDVVSPYFYSTTEALYTTFDSFYTNTFEAYFTTISDQVMDSGMVFSHLSTAATGEYIVDVNNNITSAGATAPGVWIFRLPLSKKMTVTLEGMATPEGVGYHVYGEYNFTEISLDDTELDYHGTVIVEYSNNTFEATTNPFQAHIAGYIKDSTITEPITLEIDITQTGVGTPQDYKYTDAQATGTFISKELRMDGTLSTDFFQNDLYPMPSSISFNGDIDTGLVDVNGVLNATMVSRLVGATYEAFIDTLSFQGYISAEGSEALTFNGGFSSNIFQNEYYSLPSTLSWNGNFSSKVFSASGNMNYTLAVETINSKLVIYPTSLSFSGRMDTEVVTFEGDLSATISKQVIDGNINHYPVSLSVNGQFTPDILGFNGAMDFTYVTENIGGTIYGYPSTYALHGSITSEIFDFYGDITFSEPDKFITPEGIYITTYSWFEKGVLDGRFSSDVFSFDGTLTMDYDQTLAADIWGSYYPVSTMESFSLQNAEITTDAISIKASDLSATFIPQPGHPNVYAPSHTTITNAEISAPGIKVTGDYSVDLVQKTVSPYGPEYTPTAFSFTGTYSDLASPESSSTGTWSYICPNAATAIWNATTEAEKLNYPQLTSSANLTSSGPGFATFQLITTGTRESFYQVSSSIFYGHGLNTLDGNVNVSADGTIVTVSLVSQLGITTNLSMTFTDNSKTTLSYASGTVKNSSNTTLATFGQLSGMLRIDYIDSSFETLF
ncbi:hypothetical protein ACFL4F_01035 [Candidatus Margulisiibacteriota bacterium]